MIDSEKALKGSNDTSLVGFGVFKVSKHTVRKEGNPNTGETLHDSG